jgi:hypothetical protein
MMQAGVPGKLGISEEHFFVIRKIVAERDSTVCLIRKESFTA